MSCEEERALIEPRRGRNDPSVHPLAILVFSERELEMFCNSADNFQPLRKKLFNNICYELHYKNKFFTLIGPALGAPLAVLTLEKLIALGARQIIAFGSGGSLQSNLSIGEYVIPSSAVSEEGTSAHYPLSHPPEAHLRIVDVLKTQCALANKRVFLGKVWTTDAPYRETVEKVKNYQTEGILAVEMEMSALFTVACFRKVELGGLLVISDELYDLKWKSGFESKAFLSGLREGCEIILNTAASL